MTIATLFIDTFTVTRLSVVDDGQGGWSQTRTTVGTISGRLRPANATERTVAQQRQAQVSHVLYAAATADVQRGDYVIGAGKVVEVVAVREPSHMGHHLEIDCTEIQKASGDSGS